MQKKSCSICTGGGSEDNRNLVQPADVQSDHNVDAPPTRTLKGIVAKKTDLFKKHGLEEKTLENTKLRRKYKPVTVYQTTHY